MAEGWFRGPVAAADSFSSQNGRALRPRDIDGFIDPDVVGTDRTIAAQIMSSMSPTARGDFIYVRKDGSVISNRTALKTAYIDNPVKPIAGPPMAKSPQVYPPPPSNTGPYVRQYSVEGVTAAFGYVTIPCYQINLSSTSTAFTYFGEDGPNGETEGGLQITENNTYAGDESIQLYGRSTALGNPGNTPVYFPGHYTCGQPLLLTYGQYGTDSSPAHYGYPLFFASVGYPVYSPYTYLLPPAYVTETNVSYIYTDLPAGFTGSGSDGTGHHTPCTQCSIRRMATIAQTGGTNANSNECFGYCNGQLTIRWDQVVMGQFTYYSNDGTNINVSMDATAQAWFANRVQYPDSGRASESGAGGNQINYMYDGLWMSSQARPGADASGTFGTLLSLPAMVADLRCESIIGYDGYEQCDRGPDGPYPCLYVDPSTGMGIVDLSSIDPGWEISGRATTGDTVYGSSGGETWIFSLGYCYSP